MMPLLLESQPFNKGLSRDAIFTWVSTLDVLLAALQIYIYIISSNNMQAHSVGFDVVRYFFVKSRIVSSSWKQICIKNSPAGGGLIHSVIFNKMPISLGTIFLNRKQLIAYKCIFKN